MELDASRLPGAQRFASEIETEHAELSARLADAELRREAILSRSTSGIADAIAAAERALERVEKQPKGTPAPRPTSVASIEREIEKKKIELASQRGSLEQREAYVEEIQRVPKELVARLPDPGIVTGEEAWILCRYRRCYLADRTTLIDAGSSAIGAVIVETQEVRPDEFESLAHHLRKRDIGHGNFRWALITDPRPLARVEWRSLDAGIERTRLASSPELAAWLSERSPDHDFIRFQVWNDSFEVYLEARQVIESAGFRAGWEAFGDDQELDLLLTFGKPPPREGPVEVD
jgi:hypothetical protein